MKTTEIKVVGYENNVTPTGLNETKITAEVAENITAEVNITTGWTNSYSVMILVDGEKAAYIYSDEERSIYEVKKVKESKKTSFSRNKGLYTATYVSEKMREYKSVNKSYIAALAENGLTYEGIIEISNAMIEKMIEIREENAEEIATTDVEDDGTNEDTDDETVIKETDEVQAAHLATAEEEIARIDSLIYHIKNHIDFVKREYDFTLKNIKTSTAWYVRCDESSIMKHMDLITSGWYKRMNIGKKRLAARIKKEHNAYIGAVQDLNDNEAYLWKLQAELTESQNEIEELEVKKAELENTLNMENELIDPIETPAEETVVEDEEVTDLENRNEELQADKDKLTDKYWEELDIAPEVKVPEPVFALQAFGEGKAKFEVGKVYFSREVYTNKPKHYFKILKVNKGYITYYDDIEGRKIRLKIYDADTGNEYFCYDKYWHSNVYAYDCCKIAAAFGYDGINGECDYKDFETTTDAYNWLWKKAAGRQNFALEITVDGKRVYFYDASAENRSLEIHDDEIQKLHDEKQRCNNLHEFDGTILDTTDNDVDKLDGEIAELQNKINNTLNTCRKLAEDKLKTVIDGANDEVLIQVKFSGENFNRKLRRNDKAEIEILGNGEIFALDATGFYASYGSFKAFMAAVNGLVDAIKRGDKEYIFPENK